MLLLQVALLYITPVSIDAFGLYLIFHLIPCVWSEHLHELGIGIMVEYTGGLILPIQKLMLRKYLIITESQLILTICPSSFDSYWKFYGIRRAT